MKHAKETHKVRNFFIILLILATIYVIFRFINMPNSTKKVENMEKEVNNTVNEIKNNALDVNSEKTIENEKLVLESNYENNRIQKVILVFINNGLTEKNIYEKYEIPEDYYKEKEIINDASLFELIKFNDETLEIYYKDLNSKDDYNKSYEEIYNKYMGIIGAYNVIE